MEGAAGAPVPAAEGAPCADGEGHRDHGDDACACACQTRSPCQDCHEEAERVPPEESEPTAMEHVRFIAGSAAVSGAAYGLYRLVLPSERTEDAVDMVHSLATSAVAMYGMARMESQPLYGRALPPALAHGRGPVVKMFAASLGYFAADCVKIAVDVLLRGKYPHMWAGRLVHHFVQLGAIWPGLFCKGAPHEQVLAWRSNLCMAYVAELSSIFLRLSNLLRQGPARPKLQLVVNWALVVSFFGSRIVNFARAIAMFVRARPVLAPHLFRLGISVQASGYTLSAVWFLKVVRIALKATVAGTTPVPSIEC